VISSSLNPHLLRRNSLKIPQSGGVVEGAAVWVQKWVIFMMGFALNASGGSNGIAMDVGLDDNGTSFVISRFHIK